MFLPIDPFFDTVKDTSPSQLLTVFGSGVTLAPANKVTFVSKSAEFTSIFISALLWSIVPV